MSGLLAADAGHVGSGSLSQLARDFQLLAGALCGSHVRVHCQDHRTVSDLWRVCPVCPVVIGVSAGGLDNRSSEGTSRFFLGSDSAPRTVVATASIVADYGRTAVYAKKRRRRRRQLLQLAMTLPNDQKEKR